MPVVVIAAAAATFIEGAALVGAALTVAETVAAGAMMVGSALTIVGTITGNEKLTKWGAIIGIAGGLGSIAVGAMEGAATTAAADTGGALADASAADITAQTAGVAEGENVGSVLNGAAPATPQPSGLLSSAGDQAAASQALTAPGAAPPDLTANAPAPTPAAATPAPGAGPSSTSTFNAPAPSTDSAFNAPAPPTTSAFNPAPVTDASAPVPGAGSSTGYFDSMGRWIRQNPELAKAGFQGASGLLTSLAPTPLNKYYNAKAAQTQSETEIARQRAGLAPGWWYK
jgi:hypothetical protein